MTANHSEDVLDLIRRLKRRVEDLEASRALGAQAAVCTSTTHPSPTAGSWILETDTGLYAVGNGSTFVYPPQQIAKRVLTASAASVTFSSIPQTFTNLRLEISAKSDGTGTSGYDTQLMQFNGITTASYNWASYWLIQGGAAISASTASSQTSMLCGKTWNAFFGTAAEGITVIDVPNYSDTTRAKSFTSTAQASDGGTTGILQNFGGTLSGSTAAITSLTLVMGAGNYASGSTFNLYGM